MSNQDRSPAPLHFYDDVYRTDNYFHHGERLYRPYIRSLIVAAGLEKGAEILDAGCGQGFFSHLFATEGMQVYGTDVSLVGLQTARKHYRRETIRFFVSDLTRAPTSYTFDAVFVRSCSLYNTDQQEQWASTTASLLAMVKPGGRFMFAYNTNLSGHGQGWRHHRLEDIRALLAPSCATLDLYFLNRIDALLLGPYAFNHIVTRINKLISERTKLGGEAVAIFRKHEDRGTL
jgi:SAM-dependent methyltransferase